MMKRNIWICRWDSGPTKPAMSAEVILPSDIFSEPKLAFTIASPRPDRPQAQGRRYEKGTKVYIWSKADADGDRQLEPLTVWLSPGEAGQLLWAIQNNKEWNVVHAPYDVVTVFSVKPSPEGISVGITKKYQDGQKVYRSVFIKRKDNNGPSKEFIKFIQLVKGFSKNAWFIKLLFSQLESQETVGGEE